MSVSRYTRSPTPLRSVFAPSTPVPPPSIRSPRLPLVLIADDVPENRKLFTLYLRGKFEVVTASTVEEALSLLRQRPFEAALLDINYGGGKDGFDAIREIRADPQLAKLPAAALTAHVAPEDRDQCINAGFDAFLAKPVRRAEMQDALRSLLRLRAAA